MIHVLVMRNYNVGVSRRVAAAIMATVILTAGVFAIFIYFLGPNNGPPSSPKSLGAITAEFLNSKRDDVQFYWMCNSTFVNEDLTDFYKQSEPSAYVDGVLMNRTAIGGDIGVLFSPWHSNIVGVGEIQTAEWDSLSGAIIDDGIGLMEEPTTPPMGDFLLSWPITFYFEIYFDDGTCFFAGFSSIDGYLYIQNGTWSGEFSDFGWPIPTSWHSGAWLLEGGYLSVGMNAMYTVITSNVSYP